MYLESSTNLGGLKELENKEDTSIASSKNETNGSEVSLSAEVLTAYASNVSCCYPILTGAILMTDTRPEIDFSYLTAIIRHLHR